MDQLTVDHRYDPETGFIVAREVVALPSVLADGPSLADAVVQSRETNTLLIVFATADRCAPCQQYKKDALNDPRVIRRLMRDDVLATHIEVDRDPAAAQKYLGSAAIPMTYLLRHGEVVETLPGQRSADTLYEWLNSHVN
jgi:thioredoxin-like negative regulator of GroEL